MGALPAVIKPDRDKSQNRKPLFGDLQRSSEYRNHIHQTADHIPVDPYHADQLSDPAEGNVAAEIEQKHHPDPVAVIIHKSYESDKKSCQYTASRCQ